MKKDENVVNVLDELNKGACMGLDAIEFIIPKVMDEALKKELKRQYDKYDSINKEIEKIYPKYSKKKPHETNMMNQTMTWWGIEMNTMKDSSTSKLAELIMQGTNMGIIEGRRLLNKKDVPENIQSILQEYVDMQEDAIEKLKEFL